MSDIDARARSFLDTHIGGFKAREIIAGLMGEITLLRSDNAALVEALEKLLLVYDIKLMINKNEASIKWHPDYEAYVSAARAAIAKARLPSPEEKK